MSSSTGDANDPLTAANAERVARRSFTIMCICFGLNHAAVTTPIGYASSALGPSVGNASNAILYGVCLLSALFLGPLLTSSLGPKLALVGGMLFYVIYVLCFAAASFYVDPKQPEGCGDLDPVPATCVIVAHTAAWVFACVGSAVGGLGAGSLWTAQGAFFGAICERVADATGTPLQAVTAELASVFAIWYLGQEAFWKSLATVLQKWVLTPAFEDDYDTKARNINSVLFGIYGVLALVATVVQFMQPDIRAKKAVASGPLCEKASSAFKMWNDPKIWLISGMNITFGIAASYLNGFINPTWQAKALGGGDFIGFLGAIISLISAISSKVYSSVAEKMGTKMPIVIFGCACFLLMSLLSFITAPNGEGPGGWGAGIVVFYVLQGMGRGVYESTNKGIFADYYPGEKSIGAFANCIMQNTFSSTIGYAVGIGGPSAQQYLVWVLIPSSLLTVPMLWLASTMKKPSSDEN